MFAGAEGAHADPVWSQILLCLHTQSSEVSKFKDNVCICDCTIEGEREREEGEILQYMYTSKDYVFATYTLYDTERERV